MGCYRPVGIVSKRPNSIFGPALHHQCRVSVERVYAPLDAGNQIGLAVAVEIARPSVRPVVSDPDRLAETAERKGRLEDRIGSGSADFRK